MIEIQINVLSLQCDLKQMSNLKKQKIMKPNTRKFLEMAYVAMQNAYYNEVNNNDPNQKWEETEITKQIGEVMQMVGDLTRMP